MKNALFLLLTAAVLVGCNKEDSKVAAPNGNDPALVTPAPELLAQLKLGDVSIRPVAETLRVAGRIDFDEQRLARIGATVTGRVTQIDALLGQEVKKGDVLARLNSSELSSQQLAYLKARSQLELNRRNAERAKALFDADVIAAAEMQRRDSEYQISVAETRAAADQLQILGVSPAAVERLAKNGAVDSVTPVVATLGGVVVERKLAQGQVVQPADALFVVADLSRLWAVAQVPEQQVSQVKVGQTVNIEVPALGNEKLIGKLIFVGQTINPETRTVLVRTELDNTYGRLKPAMLASMLIEAKPVERMVIPASAVVRENDEEHVFVAEGDGVFRLLKVKLGPEQGGQRVVISGLKGQEKLVVDGAFHLNNERNRKEMEGVVIESLVRGALKQRLIVAVIAAVLFFFGLDAARKLSVDAFPDVTNVQVQIATEAPGRSPEEVERFATVPLEVAMTGLPGLEEMRSLNKPGLSLITLVFNDKTNVYFARQLVMERLLEVGSRLPQGIAPVLGPVSTGLGEVYQYTLERPDDGDRTLTQDELMQRRIAQDWVVRPLLRSIPGVAEINSQGGYAKQYQVLVNPDKLRHFGLAIADVYQAVGRNNANAGGGVLPQYAEQYLIRGVGLVRDLDDLRAIVLREKDGVPVYVRDVAEVQIGHDVRQGALVKNGVTEAVGGVVMMIAGGNAKEVVGRIKARVDEINAKGMLPDGLKIVPYYDRSELVDAALWTVTKVLLEGVVLVVVVLFLFLGDVRSSLIVVATLVLTPLLTFIAMNKFGISANLMSLGGLAIAIGLMVDGSVVVVENAYLQLGRNANKGESPLRVILHAVVEVATPVIFGVGIIILVFLPLMTLQGMEGKMFAPLAYTIAIALGISLILSMTLTPVMSTYLLKPPAHDGDHDTRLIAAMKQRYLKMLHWALGNEKKTVAAAVGAFVLTIGILPFLGTAFIPEMKEGSVVPGINRVPNISLDESIKMEMEAMRLVMQVPGVKSAVSGVGRGESPADPQGPNESTPIVSLKPRSEWPSGWTQDDIQEAMREKLKVLPGVQIVMAQPISDRVDEMVTGVRSDIAVKVFGDDLDQLRKVAGQIGKVAQTLQGAQDLRIERISGQQYLSVEIDRQAIARLGLNVSDVNDVLETAIGGKVATEIFEGERRFPGVVRLPERFRNNVEAISNVLITSPNGAQVRLTDVAKISIMDGPAQISRELGKRRIVVGVNVKDRDLGSFVAELQQKVEQQIKLPEGYYLEWGGQFQNMERALGHLMVIIPITIAAIFFLLFLLFNSLRFATLIITVLPFASIGGIIGLFVTREYLSVPASVGFIALWGIAVLNGVVLVSYIRGLRENGRSVRDAVVEGATLRFRPVMMTATVAMLGLIPFLFSSGPGSEVQRPLAIVVIGGLITCTLLTLLVLPTIYRWFDEEEVEA